MLFESRFDAGDESIQAEILWTPLIDMVFILIVFFAVTMTFATQQSVLEMDLPQAASGAAAEASRMVQIGPTGSISYAGNAGLTPEEFGSLIAGEPADGPAWEVAAERSVPYEHVIAVLDQLRLARQTRVLLSVEARRR
ncbi:biopolymer transporter ExbD [bacterium]|nr:biopolymer transporter ExbD [bacterium]